MSQAETEAQALLRSGALYPERVGLQPNHGDLIFFGVKHGAISLYFGNEPSYHFDLEGRWLRCYVHPSHLLRRLDGSTQAIDRPRVNHQMLLNRRTLDPAEAAALDASIRQMALGLIARLDSGDVTLIPPPAPARSIAPDQLRELLSRISRWDAARWDDHRRAFARTYGPLPVLPPDSQDALVLQATVAPGSGAAVEVRSPEAFAEHCRNVTHLLGKGIIPSRNLFLAGPDVLCRSPDLVESYLRIAGEAFPLAEAPAPPRRLELPVDRPHREGIHAVLGASDGPLPDASAWSRYQALGLRRVTFGLAFGSDPNSAWPITPRDDLKRLIAEARAAHLAVSLVVWPGSLDPSTEAEERTRTVALIESLPFGKGDHVYTIENDDATEPPITALRSALTPLRRTLGLKVLPYNLRKQGL
ncbi:hypothetical protein [Tautonia marina]|uniref:hypothetical protein n=1 Tax=Tautonia marina TaxID=2653855 RepID=UPI0012606052|nr:hypothetical protein [Tautonia marina]